MMDANSLYPDGFHPVHQQKHPTQFDFARYTERLYSTPVKYYFIDFGMSVMFSDKLGTNPVKWRTKDGREREAPEIKDYAHDKYFNAYLLDIFILGKVYERRLTQVST